MGIISLSEFIWFVTLFVDLLRHLVHSFYRECSVSKEILFILCSEVKSIHTQQTSSVLSKLINQVLPPFLAKRLLHVYHQKIHF